MVEMLTQNSNALELGISLAKTAGKILVLHRQGGNISRLRFSPYNKPKLSLVTLKLTKEIARELRFSLSKTAVNIEVGMKMPQN